MNFLVCIRVDVLSNAAWPVIRIDECTFRANLLLFHFTIQGWKPSGHWSSIVEKLSVVPLVQLFPALECSALIRGIFFNFRFFFISKFITFYCGTLPASTVGFYNNNSLMYPKIDFPSYVDPFTQGALFAVEPAMWANLLSPNIQFYSYCEENSKENNSWK